MVALSRGRENGFIPIMGGLATSGFLSEVLLSIVTCGVFSVGVTSGFFSVGVTSGFFSDGILSLVTFGFFSDGVVSFGTSGFFSEGASLETSGFLSDGLLSIVTVGFFSEEALLLFSLGESAFFFLSSPDEQDECET